MSSQKVLIIAYYWPPSGGSGVQRWLKFAKYLPQFGWQPFVFTPENPSFVEIDESLQQDVPDDVEVLRFPIWEPYNIFFKLSGSKQDAAAVISSKKKSAFQTIASWIRGNLFIPDPKIFWIRPSVKFLHSFLKENQIDTIVTTGPPHSMHLIGLRLKRKNKSLRWIADFRDPWSEWPFIRSFNTSSWAMKRHAKLEKAVLTEADSVLAVTPGYKRQFEKLANRKVDLITNGFDEDDFAFLEHKRGEKFVLLHVGIVYSFVDPTVLTRSIELIFPPNDLRRSLFELRFVGPVNAAFKSAMKNSAVGDMVNFIEPVPHKELMRHYSSSAMLLINIEGYENSMIHIPGKCFEYLACDLPIIGLGPKESDVAILLRDTGAGEMFESNEEPRIAGFIRKTFDAWQQGAKPSNREGIQKYSRKKLTEKLIELFR